MEALTDIGDDLLEMAGTRRFVNPWRRWGRTAACLALVVCLAALALPYLPMGCGSSTSTSESAEAPELSQDMAAEESAPAESEPMENETAPPPEATEDSAATGYVVVNDVYYEVDDTVTFPADGPAEYGSYLGEVSQSDNGTLIGCKAYEGETPAEIYLQTPDGWYLARTEIGN